VAAASLTPTRAALDRQLAGAEAHGLQRAGTSSDVEAQVERGDLVRLPGNRDYELKSTVPLPYARPEVRLFVERLADQYRSACGDRLVITSLVRPRNHQPRNAHPQSVHQLGLAIDMRVSWKGSCRSWIEGSLLQLESAGVVEASRERYPPHYHVVLFPRAYLEHVEGLEGERPQLAYAPARPPQGTASELVTEAGFEGYRYVVQSGDSLWSIAQRYGVELGELRAANALRSSTLRPGQLLTVPSARPVSGGAQAQLATYQVRSGDTLWQIARRHGTSPRSLQQVNGLRTSRIYPGQVLRVPVAAGS
jgi:LysM repeat protein